MLNFRVEFHSHKTPSKILKDRSGKVIGLLSRKIYAKSMKQKGVRFSYRFDSELLRFLTFDLLCCS